MNTRALAPQLALLALWPLLAAPGAPPPAPAGPAAGARLDAAGVPLPPPADRGAPPSGDVFTVGHAALAVVVTEGPDPALPARWTAIDRAGRVAWVADHACPDFRAYPLLSADGDRLVCKTDRTILGLDAATGAEVWRYRSERPLYVTGAAGGRVAASIANAELLVLATADGRVVGPLSTPGAILEAVTTGPTGPLALFILDPPPPPRPPGAPDEGHDLRVAAPSPERRVGVLPLGGPAHADLRPMTPAWTAPFEGYSFTLVDAAGVLVGQPREGVWEGYDLATGRRLWERVPGIDEVLLFGSDGGVLLRPGPEGGTTTEALDPRTLRGLWLAPRPSDAAPTGAAQGTGQVATFSPTHLTVYDFATGERLLALRLDPVRPPREAITHDSGLAWVSDGLAGRRLHYRPFDRAPAG